jgi:hypothetical protein
MATRVFSDVDAALAEVVGRGVAASEIFHFKPGGQNAGDPQRSDYASFLSFSVPDGDGWLVQEVSWATPGDNRASPAERQEKWQGWTDGIGGR